MNKGSKNQGAVNQAEREKEEIRRQEEEKLERKRAEKEEAERRKRENFEKAEEGMLQQIILFNLQSSFHIPKKYDLFLWSVQNFLKIFMIRDKRFK